MGNSTLVNTYELLKFFVSLFLFAVLIVAVQEVYYRLSRNTRVNIHSKRLAKSATKSGIRKIDKMTGIEFEHCLKGLFSLKGYKSWTTGRNDYGADVIIEKDGLRIAIQAKRYGAKKKATPSAVRDAHGSLAHHKCQKGMVITNSLFTKAAKIQARDCGIELWDRYRLIKELEALNKGESVLDVKELIAAAEEDKYACANCGVEIDLATVEYCNKRPERFKGKSYCSVCRREIK